MEDIQIKLSAVWIALMLTYLLGDVLRIFSGDFKKMGTKMKDFKQWMWTFMAALMLIPILMVVLTLVLPYDSNRSTNILVTVFFFLFNLAGLPTYPSFYDKFLIFVGLVFNVVIVLLAWSWN